MEVLNYFFKKSLVSFLREDKTISRIHKISFFLSIITFNIFKKFAFYIDEN